MNSIHKSLVSFISPVLGMALLGLWAYKTEEPFDALGYLIFGLGVSMIGFGLYFKIRSFKSEQAGLTSEDELSKRVKENIH